MSRAISFGFPLPNGLHARPASHIEEAVRPLRSSVMLVNLRNGRRVSARSVLGLVATDTQHADPCQLVIEGADEDAAHAALKEFLDRVYPFCDEPPVPAPETAGDVVLPPSLRAAGLSNFYRGEVACGGLGWGRIAIWNGRRPGSNPAQSSREPEREREDFQRAAATVEADLQRELGEAGSAEQSILKAHLAMLRDPALAESVLERIAKGEAAAAAVEGGIDGVAAMLLASKSLYLRERALDLEDLCSRLLDRLAPNGLAAPAVKMDFVEDTVLVAKTLTPGGLLAIDRRQLRGLVLGHAGSTSHTVILARSFGIPTLTDLTLAIPFLKKGDEVIVDGRLGLLVANPSEGVRGFYRREREKLGRLARRLTVAPVRATAAGGSTIEVGANISMGQEAEVAFAQGADGIGLFRTEMLFMGREAAPDEEEQFQAYAMAARAGRGKPVIIRLLDIGGDKPVPYLNLSKEPNPFLGRRGVRWYSDHPDLIRTQFRALIRASAEGPIRILIPMVSSAQEIRFCRRIMAEAQNELEARSARLHADRRVAAGSRNGGRAAEPKLGAMIEVPSAAFSIEELCADADFFSLGTNDLTQYFFATDRGNAFVSHRSQSFHPAFLRLLKSVVDAARMRKRWIGLCGELAEDPAALPLLVGLGLNEISVAPPRVGAVSHAAAALNATHCRSLLEAALDCATSQDVLELITKSAAAPVELPLVDPTLIIFDSVSRTKEEAIREMVDALHLAGRTAEPERVEAAVWKREAAFSTGFGGGFALPHCRTGDISAHSVVVLRFLEPVPWDALDSQPVDVAVLLAARDGDSHLAVLARFSRLMLRDEFCARLRTEKDPVRLGQAIRDALGITAAPESDPGLRPEPGP